MRIPRLYCFVVPLSLLTFLSTAVSAQIPTTQPNAPADSIAKSYDDAGYRKLDETLQFFRGRSAREYAIDASKGIDEASYVSIGGIDQWVTIRGDDRKNPVLLFLHGGPGEATSLWSLPYFFPWERRFSVVQWDQRGAGKTFGKSGPSVAPTLTLDQVTQDGLELTESLRKRLGKRKIILVAHSFGTVLGLRIVQTRPDRFIA